MSDEKTQTGTEYRIKAGAPGFFYEVFKGSDYGGEIIMGKTRSRLEMGGGGRKIINDVQEFLKILPKKEEEEIVISGEQIKKYTQVKITPDGGNELSFGFELGCNCGSCERRCGVKYQGNIVALEIGGEERYFAK